MTHGLKPQTPLGGNKQVGPVWSQVLDNRPTDGATFRAEAGGKDLPPGAAVGLSSR